MRIQICSDLHLDRNPRKEFNELLEPIAPVLALLGDIGDPESELFSLFLNWCCRNWSQILFVPGNHEFWRLQPASQKSISSVLSFFSSFEQSHSNFKFCWRQKLVSEDGVIILATPLWSRPVEGRIPDVSEEAWVDPDRTFSTKLMADLHDADLKWLNHECKLAKHTPVVILTHYPPSLLLMDPAFVRDPDQTLYASDLDTLLRPPIAAWACGHTHQTIQWFRAWETATGDSGQILITTNPYGFIQTNPAYRSDAVLKIDPSLTSDQDVEEYLSGRNCKTLQSLSQN